MISVFQRMDGSQNPMKTLPIAIARRPHERFRTESVYEGGGDGGEGFGIEFGVRTVGARKRGGFLKGRVDGFFGLVALFLESRY